MKSLNQLKQLTLRDWRYLLTAALVLPGVWLLLNTVGFQRTRDLLTCSDNRSQSMSDAEVEQLARMTGIAARRGLFRVKCLSQAFTVYWLLGRAGVKTTLRLGCCREEGVMQAHAWVIHTPDGDETKDGKVRKVLIGEAKNLADFTPLLDVTA